MGNGIFAKKSVLGTGDFWDDMANTWDEWTGEEPSSANSSVPNPANPNNYSNDIMTPVYQDPGGGGGEANPANPADPGDAPYDKCQSKCAHLTGSANTKCVSDCKANPNWEPSFDTGTKPSTGTGTKPTTSTNTGTKPTPGTNTGTMATSTSKASLFSNPFLWVGVAVVAAGGILLFSGKKKPGMVRNARRRYRRRW